MGNNMAKKTSQHMIVFDKDYKALGRIVNIEKNKKTGKIQVIWINLFPEAKYVLLWESSQAIPIEIKNFKSIGDFYKLKWNLNEIKNHLEKPINEE